MRDWKWTHDFEHYSMYNITTTSISTKPITILPLLEPLHVDHLPLCSTSPPRLLAYVCEAPPYRAPPRPTAPHRALPRPNTPRDAPGEISSQICQFAQNIFLLFATETPILFLWFFKYLLFRECGLTLGICFNNLTPQSQVSWLAGSGGAGLHQAAPGCRPTTRPAWSPRCTPPSPSRPSSFPSSSCPRPSPGTTSGSWSSATPRSSRSSSATSWGRALLKIYTSCNQFDLSNIFYRHLLPL